MDYSPFTIADPPDVTNAVDVWTLHIPATWESLDRVKRQLVAAKVDHWSPLGVLAGDRWAEWCEVAQVEDDRAIHLYFQADTLQDANALAREVLAYTGFRGAVLSPGRDWSIVTSL